MDPRAPKNPSFNEILWQLDRLAGASVLDNHATMAAQRARYILAEVQKHFETEEKDQEYTDEIKKMLGIACYEGVTFSDTCFISLLFTPNCVNWG